MHTRSRTSVPLVLLCLMSAAPARAQAPDSVLLRHPPGGALWRAAVLPGWGQVYNRQYYKLPFVYLGLGLLTYSVVNTHRDYVRYRNAFQYRAFQDLVESGAREDNPRAAFEADYNRLVAKFGPISAAPIRAKRDVLRRNRDLTVLGIGLVYGLQMLDAYVSAHLFDFDVDEDLTVALRPHRTGLTATLRFSF